MTNMNNTTAAAIENTAATAERPRPPSGRYAMSV